MHIHTCNLQDDLPTLSLPSKSEACRLTDINVGMSKR